jgi:hypothetical protein
MILLVFEIFDRIKFFIKTVKFVGYPFFYVLLVSHLKMWLRRLTHHGNCFHKLLLDLHNFTLQIIDFLIFYFIHFYHLVKFIIMSLLTLIQSLDEGYELFLDDLAQLFLAFILVF